MSYRVQERKTVNKLIYHTIVMFSAGSVVGIVKSRYLQRDKHVDLRERVRIRT
jgi:hypothetical protein